MSTEDLPVSILRHATSKIKTASDLDGIATLGFRGEALAAISSVSRVKILTRMKEKETGNLLECEPGAAPAVSEVGCAAGTSVIVEDLFANVPARKKFLKKDATETAASSAVMEKIALSHPEISFRFIADGALKYQTEGDGSLQNAIWAVLGREFASKLISVEGECDGIKVAGYVGRSDNNRANRANQNFFINGRYIKSKTICAALEQAFNSYMAEGKFPVCVLFINIAPHSVDVNVHPAKLEVRFSDERTVFGAVYYTVKNSLENDTSKSSFSLPDAGMRKREEKPKVNAFVPLHEGAAPKEVMPSMLTPADIIQFGAGESGFYAKKPSRTEDAAEGLKDAKQMLSALPVNNAPDAVKERESSFLHNKEEPKEANEISRTEEEIPAYRIIGVAFDTYIIAETDDTLIMIDKHAAHERIIFEKLKREIKSAKPAAQLLALPIEIPLTLAELDSVGQYGEEIDAAGFEYELSPEGRKILVTAIPAWTEPEEAGEMFAVIARRLTEYTGSPLLTREQIYEKALYQAACKAALKGGRQDRAEDIKWICDILFKIPNIRVCPHGRPVLTEMKKSFIDRQFGRA